MLAWYSLCQSNHPNVNLLQTSQFDLFVSSLSDFLPPTISAFSVAPPLSQPSPSHLHCLRRDRQCPPFRLRLCGSNRPGFPGAWSHGVRKRRTEWLRTGTFYSKNTCPQGSEYEHSATDFVWCSSSKCIDFSPRSLNRTKIVYRYIIYIKIVRRSKS
jgi:hypothetical protein